MPHPYCVYTYNMHTTYAIHIQHVYHKTPITLYITHVLHIAHSTHTCVILMYMAHNTFLYHTWSIHHTYTACHIYYTHPTHPTQFPNIIYTTHTYTVCTTYVSSVPYILPGVSMVTGQTTAPNSSWHPCRSAKAVWETELSTRGCSVFSGQGDWRRWPRTGKGVTGYYLDSLTGNK